MAARSPLQFRTVLYYEGYHAHLFETGPEGPELEGLQVEKKSKAAQTETKKLLRRTYFSTHTSVVDSTKDSTIVHCNT